MSELSTGEKMNDDADAKKEVGAKKEKKIITTRMSEANRFRQGNVKAVYRLYRRYMNEENWKDKLFKHFHFSNREIDIMEIELNRILSELKTKPKDKVSSIYLNVDSIVHDYSIGQHNEVNEN